VKTHKMEFDMLNTDRNVSKEYEEYMKYEEHKEIDEEFNAPRNTVKKPQPALNAHEDLPTIATAPLDQVETLEMEFAMFNTQGDIAKVYVEYEEHEVYNEELNTDRSLLRGYYNRMDEEELRYQLLNSINEPREDAMYEPLGSKIYTTHETFMVKELEKSAVKKTIKYVNYPTKVPEKNPVKLSPAQRSTARSSPALSKSKKITVKQPPAHSSPVSYHDILLVELGSEGAEQEQLPQHLHHTPPWAQQPWTEEQGSLSLPQLRLLHSNHQAWPAWSWAGWEGQLCYL
jgi:hypothetical protein